MIRIERVHVTRAKSAQKGEDLYEVLQDALRLEFATIPPYLAAAYTVQMGANGPIRTTIADIAVEEMLHMAIVANLLNALGGRPRIADAAVVPTYPGPLPMSIGGGLIVGVRKFTKELVRDVFMKIEEPVAPIVFPHPSLAPAAATYATIGELYVALAEKVKRLGNGAFTGDPARQVVIDAGFPSEQLFPITDTETAVRALEWIRKEGEGTAASHVDNEGEPAHYYRFAEIFHGRHLAPDASVPQGFSYSGPPIPFDPGQVHDMPDDPKAADYAAGTEARDMADGFNLAYSEALRWLQRAFDGEPATISDALFSMGLLRRTARRVLETIDPVTHRSVGLPFEFIP